MSFVALSTNEPTSFYAQVGSDKQCEIGVAVAICELRIDATPSGRSNMLFTVGTARFLGSDNETRVSLLMNNPFACTKAYQDKLMVERTFSLVEKKKGLR